MFQRLSALGLAVALAAPVWVALAAPAWAAPTLRSAALVSGELVTLGDLVDGVETGADLAVFRAPDPGQTGDVPAAAVIAAARRAGLDLAAGGVSEVTVTRASRILTRAEVEAAITARASTDFGVDVDAIDVTLDDPAGARHLDAAAKGPLDVARFVADRSSGRFEATIEVAGAAAIRVSGAAVETVAVATLNRSLARGDLVARADVAPARLPKSQARDAASPDEVVGLAARRAIREGQPLRSNDLMRPQHVERGSFVTVVYLNDGISLSLKAKALAAGAAGDLIAVQNIQSKRTVNGVVTGPSEVTVTAGPTALARR
ncbi:flagellar basal body P-ring formation chaperone FlgA [Hansschlegelia sp. KR7-227]|uniref:flagellar basal body P-ring formation chaperone FlgA n=1 Tax=Hansschlegelia sp. KR7-227 TaxID=3400914 RepID=UPI003C03CD44